MNWHSIDKQWQLDQKYYQNIQDPEDSVESFEAHCCQILSYSLSEKEM